MSAYTEIGHEGSGCEWNFTCKEQK